MGLATLHGINEYAKKISIRRGKDGEVKVLAQYREVEIPSPGKEIGQKILEYVREMTHIEGEGKIPLILGVRNDSIKLEVKLKKKIQANTPASSSPNNVFFVLILRRLSLGIRKF